jgi:hypothetical protein
MASFIVPVLSVFALFQGVANADDGNHVANKDALFDGLGDINQQGLWDALKHQDPISVKQWDYGYLPANCKDHAGDKCSPYDINVYDVEFSDVRDIYLYHPTLSLTLI